MIKLIVQGNEKEIKFKNIDQLWEETISFRQNNPNNKEGYKIVMTKDEYDKLDKELQKDITSKYFKCSRFKANGEIVSFNNYEVCFV